MTVLRGDCVEVMAGMSAEPARKYRHAREWQLPIPECLDCWDDRINDICMEPEPEGAKSWCVRCNHDVVPV